MNLKICLKKKKIGLDKIENIIKEANKMYERKI